MVSPIATSTGTASSLTPDRLTSEVKTFSEKARPAESVPKIRTATRMRVRGSRRRPMRRLRKILPLWTRGVASMVLQLQRLRQVTTQAAGLIGPYRNHEAPGNEKACSCLFAGRQDETQVIESILVYYQQSGSRIASCVAQVPQGLGSTVEPSQNTEELMAYKETFWM